MDGSQFDRISRLFAQRRLNRRAMLQGSAAAGMSLGLAATSAPTTLAQPATSVAEDEGGSEFLFVQSFGRGDLAEGSGTGAAYTLTLGGGLGETLYFSNRPDRIVGTVSTPRFLDTLGFSPDNPPNAALVGEKENGDQDLLVVELLEPAYDESTHTATYGVNVLQDDERVGMQFVAASAKAPAAATYTSAHLFIDDCPDTTYCCKNGNGDQAGYLTVGTCWAWKDLWCNVCSNHDANCNATYPDACQGPCTLETC